MTAKKRSTYKKSASDLKKPPRLKRTLKRDPVFREINSDDLRYLWVTYKLGELKLPEGLEPNEFNETVLTILNQNYDYAWAFIKKGKPIGFLFGSIAHGMTFLSDAVWIKASPRNKIENIVNICNILRKVMKFIFICSEKDKDFYVHIAKHGIIRRVGHINDISDHPMIQFESRI